MAGGGAIVSPLAFFGAMALILVVLWAMLYASYLIGLRDGRAEDVTAQHARKEPLVYRGINIVYDDAIALMPNAPAHLKNRP